MEPKDADAYEELMRGWLRVGLDALKAWYADNAFKHSAAVSFYTLFSLAPITLITVSVAGFFFGEEIATRQFRAQLTQLVGTSSAEVIEKTMEAAQTEQRNGLSSVVGLVLLLIGATTVFGQLQQSLNDIWSVTTKPTTNTWLIIIVKRVVSFAMVLTVGFLLVVSLVLTTALTAIVELARAWLTIAPWVLRTADIGVGLAIITILFLLIHMVLPDARVHWREALIGAFVTAVLFSIGRFLIAWYLGHTTVASTYGAAGSLVALLIWIYYSCAIFFYGAEYVRAHRLRLGLRVEPKETAVLVRRVIVEDPEGGKP